MTWHSNHPFKPDVEYLQVADKKYLYAVTTLQNQLSKGLTLSFKQQNTWMISKIFGVLFLIQARKMVLAVDL